MVKLNFDGGIEPGVRAEIEKHLQPWLWLVPTWCHNIYIYLWNSSDGDSAIETSARYEYRWARMRFYSAWLIDSDRGKALYVVHDLLHITNAVYVDYAEEQIQNLCKKSEAPQFHSLLMEESRMRCESMTQDLAAAIYERFAPAVDVEKTISS
jgi:hypothetical protein